MLWIVLWSIIPFVKSSSEAVGMVSVTNKPLHTWSFFFACLKLVVWMLYVTLNIDVAVCDASHFPDPVAIPESHSRKIVNATGGYINSCQALGARGGGDSSVVRAPDSWLKGRGFESLLERRENFLLQGRLSVLTLISVSVPPPCYRSST